MNAAKPTHGICYFLPTIPESRPPQVLQQTDRRATKENTQIRPGCKVQACNSIQQRACYIQSGTQYMVNEVPTLHVIQSRQQIPTKYCRPLGCISLCFPRWLAPRSLCCLALLSVHTGSEQTCPSISLLMSGSQQKCSRAQGDASCFEAQRQGSPVSLRSSCRPQAQDAAFSRSLEVCRQPWFN